MRRYISRPKQSEDWHDYNDLECIACTIHEQINEPRPTGLLDKQGNELFALDEREPVGFVRLK